MPFVGDNPTFMPGNAAELAVQIVRFVDSEPQPGVVACELTDAENRRHSFVDKVPIFSTMDLDDRSTYPQPGIIRCEVIARWQDASGRGLARVRTARDGVESIEGLSEFVVLATQISSPTL
jgi:hypothetical protein